MINVYPSKIEGEPIEVHKTEKLLSISEWLSLNIPSFEVLDSPPISVHLNECVILPTDWSLTFFKPSDTIDIYPEPKAVVGAFIVAYGAYIAAAIAVLAVLLMPKAVVPKQQGSSSGDPLQEASAKGNQVKVNDVIREAAGTNKIFPDYLIPPHRYYESTRQQVVDLHLCIGVGEFEVPASEILIGDTPLVSLGDTASYQIYGPGDNVSADTRCIWWHTSEEVGVSSTGSTGLELVTTFSVDQTSYASSYIFNEFLVTVPDGAGSFPIGWAEGMIVRIEVARTYTVTDGGVGIRDIVKNTPAELEPFVGMVIEISGDNAGIYVVNSVSGSDITLNFQDGSPAYSLSTGTDLVMSIGYSGLRYRITAIEETNSTDDTIGAVQMSVERLTDSGSVDTDWIGFDYYTTSDADLNLDASTTEGDWKGPFAACPDGEITNEVQIDVTMPAGLIEINKKGKTQNRSVTIEWQWRNLQSPGAWLSAQKTYVAKSLDALGFTETIIVPSAYQPEVRMRRIGAKSQSAQVQDTVQWAALKSKLKAPVIYEGVTSIALKIRGGDRVSTQTESRVSVKATRKLPIYQGSGVWSEPTATRDIFPYVAYVLKSIGYGYDKLNIEDFIAKQATWTFRGDKFDNLVESASTVKECINDALRPGYAELTVDRGTVRAARDELRTMWEQMYTPDAMTKVLERNFTAPSIDDYSGVDVEYRSAISWQTETVKCRLPNDTGLKVLKVTLEGVTDRTRAWRYGMRTRRTQVYRRGAYKFSTEMSGFNSKYLSYVMLADSVPGYAQTGILKSFVYMDSVYTLRTSEKLKWPTDNVSTISLRRPDGTLAGPFEAIRISDNTLIIRDPVDFEPVVNSPNIESTHYLFGVGYPALVTSVSPSGQYGATIEAVNYDPRVYADDDNFPPADA